MSYWHVVKSMTSCNMRLFHSSNDEMPNMFLIEYEWVMYMWTRFHVGCYRSFVHFQGYHNFIFTLFVWSNEMLNCGSSFNFGSVCLFVVVFFVVVIEGFKLFILYPRTRIQNISLDFCITRKSQSWKNIWKRSVQSLRKS